MAQTCKVQLTTRIPTLKARAERQADEAIRQTAQLVVDHAKASMSGPKSGQLYKRGKKMHRASAPGEAPAVDTGNLVNSFSTARAGRLRYEIDVNAEYAPHLEFGTSRMAARPFLRPALKAVEKTFYSLLSGIVRRGAR